MDNRQRCRLVHCVWLSRQADDGRSEERRDTENLGGRRWRRRVGPRVRIKEARDGVAARSHRVPLATHAKGRGAHVARESEGLVPADVL